MDQIISKLRKSDVELGKGKKISERWECRVLDQPRGAQRYQPRPLFIAKGSPWENGYVDSFNGKLRDELPN